MAKKTNWYRQCTYSSPCDDGETMQTAWIPEYLAKVGQKIYFGKKTETPDCLWTILSVGGRESGEYLAEHERDCWNHRKRTDI